jgi:hypothetical protein
MFTCRTNIADVAGWEREDKNMHRTPRAIGGLISVALISKRHYLGSNKRGRTASGSDMFLCLSIYCGLNLAKEYANGSNILGHLAM